MKFVISLRVPAVLISRGILDMVRNMRTKIIATLGPVSESREVIAKLIESGMDIARLNFSHCTHEELKVVKKLLLEEARKQKKEIRILQDLQGPRIRVGKLPAEGLKLEEGAVVVFSTDAADREAVFVDSPRLHLEIKKGDAVFLANGDMELKTLKIKGRKISARVVRGGILYSRKAVNVPDTKLSAAGLTRKDIDDLKFGLRTGVDYVAVSFVQTAVDITKAKNIIRGRAKIIAKIETALALKNIDAIIQASDGIMIARGDLGIEVPEEKLPFIQKNLIRHAAWHGKFSVTATQMLTSMVSHAHPTRAEVSDIANAIWDGTDAVMLSDETASGEYPIQSLRAMAKIAQEAESSGNRSSFFP